MEYGLLYETGQIIRLDWDDFIYNGEPPKKLGDVDIDLTLIGLPESG